MLCETGLQASDFLVSVEAETREQRTPADWLKLTATTAVLLLALWWGRQPLLSAMRFMTDRDGLSTFILGLGMLGPLVLALSQLAQILFAFIPGTALEVVAGYVYGFPGGFAFNLAATLIASQLAFLLARTAGAPLISRLVSPHLIGRWQRLVQKHGVALFLIIYLLPFTPADLLNYVAGLGCLSGKRFLAINLVGRAPGLALTTLIGSHGQQLMQLNVSPMLWLLLLPLGLLLYLLQRAIFNRTT